MTLVAVALPCSFICIHTCAHTPPIPKLVKRFCVCHLHSFTFIHSADACIQNNLEQSHNAIQVYSCAVGVKCLA